MPAPPKPSVRKKKEETDWTGLLFGWIFVVGALFGIVFMILSSKPEGKLVCNTEGRTVSLTTFGYCHRE